MKRGCKECLAGPFGVALRRPGISACPEIREPVWVPAQRPQYISVKGSEALCRLSLKGGKLRNTPTNNSIKIIEVQKLLDLGRADSCVILRSPRELDSKACVLSQKADAITVNYDKLI